MKQNIALIIALIGSIYFMGCGSDSPLALKTQDPAPAPVPEVKPEVKQPPCADSPLLGVYPVGTSTVIFNDDCTWTGSDCGESGTYTNTSDYTTFVAITSTCLPKVPLIQKCNYAFKDSKFYFYCLEEK